MIRSPKNDWRLHRLSFVSSVDPVSASILAASSFPSPVFWPVYLRPSIPPCLPGALSR